MQKWKVGSSFGQTTQIKDSGGNKVSIPGGFKVTTDSADNASDGIVIEDASGNQFVWIPVKQASDFVQDFSYPCALPSLTHTDTEEGYPVRNLWCWQIGRNRRILCF